MKYSIQYSLLVILCACINKITVAQAPATQDSVSVTTELKLPPLNELIDSALKHNAMLSYRKMETSAKRSNLESQRTYWLRNLGVQGDSRYGNIDAFSTNANGVSTNVSTTSSRQVNYAVGVYFKIPVYDIINRKSQVKQASAELEQSKYMEKVQEDELRMMVIRQYEDLLLKQKLASIKSLNYSSVIVNMEMAEKQFRNGIIPVVEYVRISEITARIQSDYETSKSEFLLSKKLLEEITGVTFK